MKDSKSLTAVCHTLHFLRSRFLSSLLMLCISIGILLVHPNSAHAFVSATGTFTAAASCPALSSIRRQANPGNINISPDNTYRWSGEIIPAP